MRRHSQEKKSFSRKLKRSFIWIRKSSLRGKTHPSESEGGGTFSPSPTVSELHDKQQEKSSFSCVREVRRLSESRQSAFLFARSFITISLFIASDWGAPASTVRLWWRGAERRQHFQKAWPSVWDGVEQTADCVSHICQVNRVQRRCHCVWEVSAGGSKENVGSGRAEVIELLYRREGGKL